MDHGVHSAVHQRCPSLDFFLEPEPSFFDFVILGEPEPELFWFSFFGGARARAFLVLLFWGSQSFFRFVFLGEPEPKLAKPERPGLSWSRVFVFSFDLM